MNQYSVYGIVKQDELVRKFKDWMNGTQDKHSKKPFYSVVEARKITVSYENESERKQKEAEAEMSFKEGTGNDVEVGIRVRYLTKEKRYQVAYGRCRIQYGWRVWVNEFMYKTSYEDLLTVFTFALDCICHDPRIMD